MKKLAKYLKAYWKSAVLAPLLMLLEVITDLIQPRLMAEIIDQGIARGDIDFIIQTGFIMVVVALIGVMGGFGCTVYSSIAAQGFGTDLRSDLFRKIQSFSFVNLDKFNPASLITRLTNDILQVQNMVLMMLRILVRAPLLSLGGLIMAILINPGLALILVGAVPVLALSLAYVIKKGIPLYAQVQLGLDRVNRVIRENLSGIRVIKAFVRRDYETNRFNSVNQDFMEIGIRASRTIGMIMPIMMLVLNFSILAVVWFGGVRVNQGEMQLGEVIAFITYMSQILFSLMIVGYMLMMVARAKVSADRVLEVLETETEIKDAIDALDKPITQGKIEFDHITYRYAKCGGDPVLQDFTFTVNPGETLAILGATGTGKSTLVNLIPRFYDPCQGRVLVDGRDVRRIKLDVLRKSISMVLQETILFSGTVWENIRWGSPEASDREVIRAAKAAQAHDFIIKLPQGYETMIGQRGVNLSGGQKQRIAIARAIIKKPVILILDDSTSAVDVATESLIQQELKEEMEHTTCLVIAQRISTVMEADRILLMEEGRIAGVGTHKELLEKNPLYQDIYYSQLGAEVI